MTRWGSERADRPASYEVRGGIAGHSELHHPGGPNQLYRFEALVSGVTTITFRKGGTSGGVSEVVEVQ